MTLDALLLDLDDTLLVEYASADEAFHQACLLAAQRYAVDPDKLHATARRTARTIWHAAPARNYAVDIGISSWEALWARFEGNHHPALDTLRQYAPEYRLSVWQTALAAHGIQDRDLAEAMGACFISVRRSLHLVYADVARNLQALARLYPLGLVTNGLACLQQFKIDRSALAHYFEAIVIAGQIGLAKPHRAVFAQALRELGARPDRVIMVGNSLKSDIAGAQAAGLRAIWLNRLCEPLPDGIVPDAQIETLDHLEETLRAMAAPAP